MFLLQKRINQCTIYYFLSIRIKSIKNQLNYKKFTDLSVVLNLSNIKNIVF